MTEVSDCVPSDLADPRIADEMARAMNERDTRAWIHDTHLYRDGLRAMFDLERRLQPGLPVLIINFDSPMQRADDQGTPIQEMSLATTTGDKLRFGNSPAVIAELPTLRYCLAARAASGGHDGRAYFDGFTVVGAPLPLASHVDGETRFPDYGLKVLVGTSEIEQWFAARSGEESALKTFFKMYYATTGESYEPCQEALKKMRSLEVSRLERMAKRLENPPADWDEDTVEEIRAKIDAELIALGARPSPLAE